MSIIKDELCHSSSMAVSLYYKLDIQLCTVISKMESTRNIIKYLKTMQIQEGEGDSLRVTWMKLLAIDGYIVV